MGRKFNEEYKQEAVKLVKARRLKLMPGRARSWNCA